RPYRRCARSETRAGRSACLSRLLKNYLRWQYCVKNGLKMLIYTRKLRFFGRFSLVLPASPTFFNGLLELGDGHLGGFDEGDDFAANPQLQLADRAGGDYRSDDARGGLHVDFREHVAVDDFLDGAFELVTYVDGLDGHEITPGCVLKRPTQLRGQGGDGFGAFGERRALQHAVQYLGFQRGQGGGAAVAWAWQVDVEVEADG